MTKKPFIDIFASGDVVNVKVNDDDVLTENFRGTVQGIRIVGNKTYVQVKPDDSDEVWDFTPDQLSFNTVQ